MVRRCAAAYTLFACLCVLFGCGKSDPGATGPKVTYEQHCAKCHAQAGEPGGPSRGGSKGPKLETKRSADWLADYIRDPKSKKPDSKMPAFAGTIPEDQIQELAGYLAAKK